MWALPAESDEIIEIAERLFNESDIPSHRHDVISTLCGVYNRLGNEEKAIEYANKAPIMDMTRDYLLTHIYKGEKLVEHVQFDLCCFVDLMNKSMYRTLWNGDFTNDEQRKMSQRRLKLFDWIFEDGDYGFYCSMVDAIYADLAIFDAEDKDKDGTINNLSLMAECAIKFLTQDSFKHTSFLVNRLVHNSGHKGYPGSSDNECRWALNFMQRHWFDFCREDERFKAIKERLTKHAN